MADKLQQVRRSYSSLIPKERSNSWRRFCSKVESAREVSTFVQIIGNDKVRGVGLLTQGDTFAISAVKSLDFPLKQYFPMHLPPSPQEEEQEMEEVGKFINSD